MRPNVSKEHHLHLQDQRVGQARNQLSLPSASAFFSIGLLFDPEIGWDVPSKPQTLAEQHGIRSQNTILDPVTDVGTSDLDCRVSEY
jgi:hypothetical protein